MDSLALWLLIGSTNGRRQWEKSDGGVYLSPRLPGHILSHLLAPSVSFLQASGLCGTGSPWSSKADSSPCPFSFPQWPSPSHIAVPCWTVSCASSLNSL